MTRSVQETHAPQNACFGCGPANPEGLRIRSFERDGLLVARWTPAPHHEAFPGVLNGGIIGTLLDCHSNWCAAMHFMHAREEDAPPCTVTVSYAIELNRPTPSDRPLDLTARVVKSGSSSATVEGTLEVDGELCATCRGVFVAVKPGHPAYHRW